MKAVYLQNVMWPDCIRKCRYKVGKDQNLKQNYQMEHKKDKVYIKVEVVTKGPGYELTEYLFII